MLFLIITSSYGKSYGIPYLFLDPEYLGEVNFISFSILGAAFGGFLMTWNITTYILDSYRFPFLATFNRPFAIYCLNNSLLPIAFFSTYLVILVNFQLNRELTIGENIVYDAAGFVSGLFIIIFIAAIYFTTTNKNIFRMFGVRIKPGRRISKKVRLRQNMMWEDYKRAEDEFKVRYYFTARFKIRPIRGTEHYDEKMVQSVLKQNHLNALIIELATLATLVGLGFLMDYQVFIIPAGASALLLFGILVSLSGVFSFWLKGWKNTMLIVLIILVDLLVRNEVFNYQNKAYGLNYDNTPAIYSYENLKRIASPDNIEKDKKLTLAILNNWKKNTGVEKPKMVLINASGGGLSAATFTTLTMQMMDSVLNGELMKYTTLITGSSGGMFGTAYLRELYLRHLQESSGSIRHPKYVDNISKNLLNSVCFAILVNDLFYPWQKFKVDEYSYQKDRGYIMEKQLNENTGFVMDKRIKDYAQHERDALIPLMIFVPTIINDERKLFISAQPVSYLMRPVSNSVEVDHTNIDGVDFGALFHHQDAQNLKLTSAIRMNGTYPYILPNVTLPSIPVIKVMDAGFRDNYGIETSTRFIHVFREWIKQNTSGVVLIQIRNFQKEKEIDAYHNQSIIDRIFNPISNLYSNWDNIQDYNHNYLVSYALEWLDGNLEIINFEYIPEKKEQETSMSFHLTTKEKLDIKNTRNNKRFINNLEKLKKALGN